MTKREFYAAIEQGQMNEEIKAMAKEMREAMEASLEKRSVKQAERAQEAYAPFIEKFVAALTAKPQTATQLLPIFEGMITPSGKEPSVQFVSSVAKKVIAAELAEKVDVKVEGKGKQKGYKIKEA